MRINRRTTTGSSQSTGKSSGKVNSKSSSDFQGILQQYEQSAWGTSLDALLERLDVIGRRLVLSSSVNDFNEYKKTLTGFFQETHDKAFRLKEETGWNTKGQRKVYQGIEVINSELEELYKLVIDKEKNSMKILAKLDNIKGMLIDLYT